MELRKAHVFTALAQKVTLLSSAKRLGLFEWQGLLVLARRIRKVVDRWRGVSGRDYAEKTYAEDFCIRSIQAECFNDEINRLLESKNVSKKSKILNVRPFINSNGILCADRRVTRLNNLIFNNNPAILDGKHPAVKLLLKEYHRRFYHASHEIVVNEVRQKYYVIGLRNTLRSITYNCLICKLQRAKPQNPLMASLPEGRVAYRQRPFSHVA